MQTRKNNLCLCKSLVSAAGCRPSSSSRHPWQAPVPCGRSSCSLAQRTRGTQVKPAPAFCARSTLLPRASPVHEATCGFFELTASINHIGGANCSDQCCGQDALSHFTASNSLAELVDKCGMLKRCAIERDGEGDGGTGARGRFLSYTQNQPQKDRL
jgi:hypothetical protein